MRVTVFIPARNELYLRETVADVFAKAAGDIEVIVALDDCWNMPLPDDKPNLTIIHWGGRRGLRAGINAAAQIGRGDFLMKLDAHCMLDEGFDVKLSSECDADWLVVPRRYSLDPDTWTIREGRTIDDYEYLNFPYGPKALKPALYGAAWENRRRTRKNIAIDENMTFQGSLWFMPMRYFRDLVYPMSEVGYGTFIGESLEIGLKVWLSGGKCMVNKKTWYAHLWKGQDYRDRYMQRYGVAYTRIGNAEYKNGLKYGGNFWLGNEWKDPRRIHDLAWLVEKFWPVPTWPEERELWKPWR